MVHTAQLNTPKESGAAGDKKREFTKIENRLAREMGAAFNRDILHRKSAKCFAAYLQKSCQNGYNKKDVSEAILNICANPKRYGIELDSLLVANEFMKTSTEVKSADVCNSILFSIQPYVQDICKRLSSGKQIR